MVLRIFSDFADGRSANHIARALNEEGLPAPHDNGRGNKGLRGWSHTTVHEMLWNERYIGVCRWNERKWVRAAGGKSRRAIKRPEHEHIVREGAGAARRAGSDIAVTGIRARKALCCRVSDHNTMGDVG